jgi:hypothetical protein
MNGMRRVAAGVLVAVVALGSAGTARADNSNSNTNTNDVTNIGDGSDTSGASSNEKTSWPPTDVGWPPKDVMNADNGETGGNTNNANNRSGATAIVMPRGQPAPTDTATPSTPETTKPIVPVAAP